MSNSLQYETSPYLLQHANNPVNWYAWNEEALALAKKENKPILVSIGYATCHWCHVMEHESFENETTAAIMNEHFINIKVDREERPDVDHLYMDALQAMTGSGGWPLNMFLTPNLEPFYGGTYFPPTKLHNRNSWNDTLLAVADAWKNRKNEIEAQATELITHLQKANSFGTQNVDAIDFKVTDLITAKDSILKNSDAEDGGFGSAPKFPQFHSISFLLKHYHFFKDKTALDHAVLSLTKMIKGGIYDQLEGGLARYSTDATWTIPHFEKMLYDNALFIQTLAEAYLITKNELFKTTALETIHFLQTNFKAPNGLYYSAMDADSERVEGKYYGWSMGELKEALTNVEYTVIEEYYNITEQGNFLEPHHNWATNILTVRKEVETIAKEINKTEKEVEAIVNSAKNKLLKIRNNRIRPITDTKCILSWNALQCIALLDAGIAFNKDVFIEEAIQLEADLAKTFFVYEKKQLTNVLHVATNNKATTTACLDDIAFYMAALLRLYNCTLQQLYVNKLLCCEQFVNKFYKDETSNFYFFSHKNATDILIRKKEVYDGATPSANAILANTLLDMGILFENTNWQIAASQMLKNLLNPLCKHTTAFAVWGMLYQKLIFGVNELTIVRNEDHKAMLLHYIPFKILKNNTLDSDSIQMQLCKHATCYVYANDVKKIINQIIEIESQIALTEF